MFNERSLGILLGVSMQFPARPPGVKQIPLNMEAV